jgi:cytochrome c5
MIHASTRLQCALTAILLSATTPLAAQARPAASVSANGVTLRSVSISLQNGDALFPGGKAAEAINNNCLACHSAEMVMTQPKLTRAQWQAEVDKMRAVYKAPVDAADVPVIVDYLAANPGLQVESK